MTNATAMPKKIGSTENGLEARFLRALRLRPGLAVPARRASPVRTAPLAFETTRLMFFSGLSCMFLYSYSKRAEGLRLNASMASSISCALW